MNMYIGNLSYNVRESDLRQVMEEYGTVESVKLIMDRNTNRSKGFAFVEMPEAADAGVQDRNPFTRKDNLYNVVDYDRYVYHIVGIEQPADPVLVGAYNVLIKQIMEDARAAIAAKREAKAKAASFVATAMNDDDLPF